MQRRTGFITVAALVLMAAPAVAGDRGSMEDQLACTPDVYRLCSQLIPDEDAIVNCLQKNLASLSPGCRRVFSQPHKAGKEDSDD